jgi:hypothetical protein
MQPPLAAGLNHPRHGAQGRLADPASWRALQAATDPNGFSAAWLALLAGCIDFALAPAAGIETVVQGGFVALRLGDARRYVRTAAYGAGEVSFLLAKAAERCLQVRRGVAQDGHAAAPAEATADSPSPPCQIAVPILLGDVLEGVVAFELAAAAAPLLDTAMRLAQWGTPWFDRLLNRRDAEASSGQADLVVQALGLAAAEGSAEAVGQALCTFLAERLGAMRVSLGSADAGPQRVIATSGGGLADSKTDFLVALGAALDESVSAKSRLLWPVPDGQLAAIGAHERLCRSHNADWAASFPAVAGRRRIVVNLEGTGPAPEAASIEAWDALVRLLAPMLALRLAAQRSLPAHGAAVVAHTLRDWTVDGNRLRWAGLAAAIAVAAFLGFATGDYRVTARATVEGAVKRVMVAPFDGFLLEANVRPGQRVPAGTVLARLDERELRLQKLEYQGRIAESQHQVDEAVGRRDMAAAAIATARRRQAEAELSLVGENLRRATLTAPFDAIVIAGDPGQNIGAPLRRGETIYELSPLDSFRVSVDVDEDDFAEVAPGQAGSLVLASLPYRFWPVTVTQVTPVASARDGRTSFRVDAKLDAQDAALRPGMQGIAKISVGERRYVWIWTHTMLAWARLKLWEWWP